jgi:predicted Ser/Thr protein kinase
MTEAREATSWREVGHLRPGDPRQVGAFEVIGRLGEGGMGVVYLAEHPDEGLAAVKFVRTGGHDEEVFRARFRREIAAARKVRSARVARVLAADADAEVPWLATAFVDGPTLHEAVTDAGPMTGERLVSLAVALTDALTAIHAADVVHRDLKPSNILLTADTPMVIDFGIASMREAPSLTRTGTALGTPGWMSPEQVQGRPCGPAADVFLWGLVVGFAASGTPPFGAGPADALFYRVVHETPTLPELPDPLDMLVPAALAKDPAHRPDVATLLAQLTGQIDGKTVAGPTLADRTAVVPTAVALGWDVEALPSRPGGRPRSVPAPPRGPVGAVAPSGERAAFWYAGEDHHTLASLAAALQSHWEDAVEQIFVGRDPIWLGELRGFLQHERAADADRIVADGAGETPPSAAMARLLLAMDPHLEPRVGSILLTPDGLAAAGEAVTGGGVARAVAIAAGNGERLRGRDRERTAERLAEIGSARILRLWRTLPGMERAAAIDERWHAGTEAFGRYVMQVAPHAGWPSPEESQRAAATLLLCAVHPEHERRLERRLAQARRTAAKQQVWWAQLAAEGQRTPPAAVLAVLTADRARAVAHDERDTARAADRERRGAQRARDRQREEAERAHERERRAAAQAARPRFVPVRRAQTCVAGAWSLALMMAALLVFVWADLTFTDDLVASYEGTEFSTPGLADSAQRASETAAGLAVLGWLLLVALPVMYVVTRTLLRQGTSRGRVRTYAAAAAAVDLVLGAVLVAAATLAGSVLGIGVRGEVSSAVPAPFTGGDWGVVAVLLPYGLVGAVLVVRSVVRLGRALSGGPVTGPYFGPGVQVG